MVTKTSLKGGVQNGALLYVLDLRYATGGEERIARSLHLMWPLCM